MVARFAAILAAVVAPISTATGIAAADSPALLGGGAGIIVNGTYCTLTTIGHDNSGGLVGLTASSCGGPNSSVDIEGGPGGVGTVVNANDDLDYAVIKFDPAKVAPTANFDGFAINGIGPDPSGFGQPVCTQGGATGFNCGAFRFGGPKPAFVAAVIPAWQPGDDGAPVTVDGQLVGMTRKGYTNYLDPIPITGMRANIGFTLFSAIMNDVNAKGVPGAGFTPIPA
jgi:hypothetical protein